MKLLKQLYCISSPSGKEKKMRKFILKYCKQMGAETYVDKSGNVYVTKGIAESYPCIVAHMDEVCPNRGNGYKVIEDNGVLMGFNFIKKDFSGIGGDDKNGIWVALKCLEKYDYIKCAFFVQEERGCIGSESADMDFFWDCRYVLQCDRRGSSDLISSVYGTDLCSDEFLSAVNYSAFGYAITSGALTDVSTLKEKRLNVSCVNISCGYYAPHTEQEYTIFSDLQNCLSFVENIIENCLDIYTHHYTTSLKTRHNSQYGYPYSYSYWSGDLFNGNNGKNNDDDYDYEEYVNEYTEMEQIISDNTDYVQNIPESELEFVADELITDYGYKHLSNADVVDIMDYYRKIA